ncbi:MAG: cbb3-type cytochrome C oxidase subunit 3 [Rhizobiales bacterium 65-79]|jgi:cytochrome c oxidase cbb3-type subunit 4|nr:cbb3-type cytochrome c oxidase subunit 3 [Hyphomicrobiales bacterium]OJU02988.1 MAG: cbb3-type cytochrome C oxidase subunit 3 [Rhizobiales bacterium 65-79]
MDYTTMRQFADSWGLLAMLIFFLGAIYLAVRPGSNKAAAEASRIPLEDDDK